ncbi:MAG: hypothetical protein QXQ14_00805 [Candidatus Aenigmatarchaeota archaeon]
MILDIVKYQYPEVYEFLKEIENKLRFEKKKRKIIVYLDEKELLILNPRFGLFIPSINFADFLYKAGKYIKIKEKDIEFIRKSKNLFKVNVEIFSENLNIFEDFAIVTNKVIGIGRTKIDFEEFSNSKKGLVAKVRKI